jgi:hypothetical protein
LVRRIERIAVLTNVREEETGEDGARAFAYQDHGSIRSANQTGGITGAAGFRVQDGPVHGRGAAGMGTCSE